MEVTQEWIKRQSRATPVLYLDVDDTVRMGKETLGRYVNNAADVQVFPEVPAILRAYKGKGWRIAAISNQGGVALGILSHEDCARAMLETHLQCDRLFDQICYCVHHPDAADPECAICWCRKPRIGLIITAATALGKLHNEYYPPHLALFVGDRQEDRQCAENAGIKFMDATEWRNGGWRATGQALNPSYVTMNETGVSQ